jgi:hypothetical protein
MDSSIMSAEFDHDLTPEQWEVLKALRLPTLRRRPLNRVAIERLIGLQLAAPTDDGPVITSQGRTVLVRGSSRLLDVVA